MFEFDTDAAFDIEKTSEYILSIQVSLDGFSFSVSVVHPEYNRLLAFKHTPLKISSASILSRHFEAWARSEELLQKHFRKIRLIVFSPHFSFIPEIFYQTEMKEAIPQYLFGKNSELEIAENFVEKLKARLIFALPARLNETAQKFFEGCETIHPLKLILNKLPETKQSYSLSLLFDAQSFYAVLSEHNKVLLANTFKKEHVSDVIYFTLNSLKQFKTAPYNTELFLSGSTAGTEKIANGMLPYFENISFLKPYPDLQNPELAGHSFLRYFTSI